MLFSVFFSLPDDGGDGGGRGVARCLVLKVGKPWLERNAENG